MQTLSLDDIKQKIEALVNTICHQKGVDVIEVKVQGHKNDVFIQMTADKPSGGITIQECAIINRLLADAIEKENFLPPEVFSLEVSSPGLDRPLVTHKDFTRCIGLKLHFWLKEAVGGKKETEGILREAGESTLTIESSRHEKLTLQLDSIIKGILVIN